MPPDSYATYAKTLKPGAPTPPSVRPAIPSYIAYDRAFTHTIWGVIFVGIELGLATIAFAVGFFDRWSWGPPGLWAAMGFAFLLTSAWSMGTSHRRLVWTAFALALSALVLFFVLPIALGIPFWSAAAPVAAAYRAYITTDTIVIPLGLAALALASFGLQDRIGRALLVAGVLAAVAVQVPLWFWLNQALDAAIAAGVAPGNPSPLLSTFPWTWAHLASVNVIPAALLLTAYERLYWQLHRRHQVVPASVLA